MSCCASPLSFAISVAVRVICSSLGERLEYIRIPYVHTNSTYMHYNLRCHKHTRAWAWARGYPSVYLSYLSPWYRGAHIARHAGVRGLYIGEQFAGNVVYLDPCKCSFPYNLWNKYDAGILGLEGGYSRLLLCAGHLFLFIGAALIHITPARSPCFLRGRAL